jgi:GT2 family glycosyltransferase
MIPICVPTLNRGHDKLQALLETALRDDNTMLPSKIIILDNGDQFPNAIDISDYDDGDPDLIKILSRPEKVVLVTAKMNMGVAASWNWFMNNVPMEHGFMILSNDDIEYEKNTVKAFYEEMQKPNVNMVLSNGATWSAYTLSKKLYEEVGGFDENFYPAYFEDNDFHYRMRLLGYNFILSSNVTYGHETSSTLAAFSKAATEVHHHNFRKNRAYFNDKWGGLPTCEKYTKPFGD